MSSEIVKTKQYKLFRRKKNSTNFSETNKNNNRTHIMIYLLKILDISYARVCIFTTDVVMVGLYFVDVLNSIYICIFIASDD